MISAICGGVDAAKYAVAYQVFMASSTVISAVTSAIAPWQYRIMSGESKPVGARRTTSLISIIVGLIRTMFSLPAD